MGRRLPGGSGLARGACDAEPTTVPGLASLARPLLAAVAVACACWGGSAAAFGLEDVSRRAQELARSPYRKPSGSLPEAVKRLSYDDYRDIRFRPERALWHGERLAFEVMFFHEGFSFTEPVAFHEVTDQGVRDIPFDPADFDYGHNTIDKGSLGGLGFAGFRVHFPLNHPDYRDEARGTASPRVAWRSTPRRAEARSSRASWSSGSSDRRGRRRSSPCSGCSTRPG
jgi:glucan biosynthesis protein